MTTLEGIVSNEFPYYGNSDVVGDGTRLPIDHKRPATLETSVLAFNNVLIVK